MAEVGGDSVRLTAGALQEGAVQGNGDVAPLAGGDGEAQVGGALAFDVVAQLLLISNAVGQEAGPGRDEDEIPEQELADLVRQNPGDGADPHLSLGFVVTDCDDHGPVMDPDVPGRHVVTPADASQLLPARGQAG